MRDETPTLSTGMFDRLRTQAVLVPPIWPFEIAGALLKAERRHRIEAGHADGFRHMISQWRIEIEAARIDIMPQLLALARAHNLNAYDASYLDLAMRRGLPLAALDGPPARATASAGVALIGAEP